MISFVLVRTSINLINALNPKKKNKKTIWKLEKTNPENSFFHSPLGFQILWHTQKTK